MAVTFASQRRRRQQQQNNEGGFLFQLGGYGIVTLLMYQSFALGTQASVTSVLLVLEG